MKKEFTWSCHLVRFSQLNTIAFPPPKPPQSGYDMLFLYAQSCHRK